MAAASRDQRQHTVRVRVGPAGPEPGWPPPTSPGHVRWQLQPADPDQPYLVRGPPAAPETLVPLEALAAALVTDLLVQLPLPQRPHRRLPVAALLTPDLVDEHLRCLPPAPPPTHADVVVESRPRWVTMATTDLQILLGRAAHHPRGGELLGQLATITAAIAPDPDALLVVADIGGGVQLHLPADLPTDAYRLLARLCLPATPAWGRPEVLAWGPQPTRQQDTNPAGAPMGWAVSVHVAAARSTSNGAGVRVRLDWDAAGRAWTLRLHDRRELGPSSPADPTLP